MIAKSVFQTLEGFDHFAVDVGGSLGDGVDVFMESQCEGANTLGQFGAFADF